MATMVTVEDVFHLASVFKFKITADLNDYQKLAIRKTVIVKDNTTIA